MVRTSIVVFIVVLLAITVTVSRHCRAMDEDVYEFSDWYGVVSVNEDQIDRRIVAFSYTDEEVLSVFADGEIKFDSNYGIVSEISVIIDDEPMIKLKSDPKVIRLFKKYRTAAFYYVDGAGSQHFAEFSLKGFSRAYRWLLTSKNIRR